MTNFVEEHLRAQALESFRRAEWSYMFGHAIMQSFWKKFSSERWSKQNYDEYQKCNAELIILRQVADMAYADARRWYTQDELF